MADALKQKRQVVILLSLAGSALAGLFAGINVIRGFPLVSMAQAATALFYLLNLVVLLKTRNLTVAATIGISVTAILLLLTAEVAGMHALFWIYTLPLLSYYLLGLRIGTAVNMLLVVSFVTFLVIRDPEFVRIEYVEFDAMLSYLLVIVFAYLYEAGKAQHAAALEHLSTTDPLTGTRNRRHLHETLTHEIERAHRYGSPLSVMMFDIDHYKQVNDRYGHSCGDEILREVAAIVRTHIRNSDHLIRYGGDEFLVLAPETPLDDARLLADKIRGLVQNHQFGCPETVTISIGITQTQAADSADGLLRKADESLYAAKALGRNRVAPASNAIRSEPAPQR